MKQLCSLFILLFTIMLSIPAYAHPGSLDEYGGHYDYSTGDYHFHHGYPAHSHAGGRCVYSFRDNTDGRYTYSNKSSTTPQCTTAPRPTMTQIHLNFFQRHPVLTGLGAFAIIIAIWIAVSSKRDKERERARQIQFEKEKQEAVAFYASHDLRTLSKMPDIYFVDDKLIPYEYNRPNGYTYGFTLDVYISHGRSEVYHSKGCIHVPYAYPKNIYSDNRPYHLRSRRPCSLCKPQEFPDIQWYNEYLSHIRKCETYGIKPVQNPAGYSPPTPKEPATLKPATPPPENLSPVPLTTQSHPSYETHNNLPQPLPTQSYPSKPSPAIRVVKTTAIPLEREPTEADIPNIPVLYHAKYPKTWRYLQNQSKDPENYVFYYHYIWGRLQEHHGDGIIYGTLTDEEQSLVDYPSVGEFVYLSSEKSKSYHSTPECYSLLRSTPIKADAIHAIVRERCTKCVPPPK